MSDLDSIIEVNINLSSSGITRTAFGIPLVLARTNVFPEMARVFRSAREMLDADFSAADPAYKAVSAIFAQSPSPTRVIVGRQTGSTAAVQTVLLGNGYGTATPPASTLFQLTFESHNSKGVAFTHTASYTSVADGSDEFVNVLAGLFASLNGSVQVGGGTDPLGGPALTGILGYTTDGVGNTATLTIAGVSADVRFLLSRDRNKIKLYDITPAVGGSIQQDINNIRAYNDTWYAAILSEHFSNDYVAFAQAIDGTGSKIGFLASSDDDILDGASQVDDVASQLRSEGTERVALMYNSHADKYPEAAWVGRCLSQDPGSLTWKFKTLSGQTPDALTTDEIGVLGTPDFFEDEKRVNHYTSIAGRDITREGIVGDTQYRFIDTVQVVDWLKARIQEEIYAVFVANEKIPYTDAGVESVIGAIKKVLSTGVLNGALAADPAPTATAPKVADVSPIERANRVLPDVEVTCQLAGAIHKVIMRVTVTQ